MMQLNIFRRILPYLPDVGSPWLRRKIVEMIPNKNVQQLRKNVDLMHERAVSICKEKKRLLAQGDEAFKDKVGEGKDLMSILRKPPASLPYIGLLSAIATSSAREYGRFR